MRWIIGIAVIVCLGVLTWFWLPRLMPEQTTTISALLPSSTYAVMHFNEEQDHILVSDSLSTLRFIVPSALRDLISTLPLDNEYWIYLYSNETKSHWGVISKNDIIAIDAISALEDHQQFDEFHRYQSAKHPGGTASPGSLDDLLTLEDINESYVYVRPHRLLNSDLIQTTATLSEMLAANFESDAWIAMELNEQNGLYRMMGVEKRIEKLDVDRSMSQTSSLLNYLPAQSGAGIIEMHDSLAIAAAYCPYQIDDTTSDENLFLFTENLSGASKPLEAQQSYQSIPISIIALDSLPSRIKPAWIHEAYVAQLSTHIRVYGASFKAISSIIDDFLADDRLISSPYYAPLEPYISEASFTLFMRPDILRISDAYIMQTRINAPINTLIYQSFEELPLQQFHALTVLHDKQIKDLAPLAWSTVLDTVVARGPWAFKNHYNDEPEVLVQDAHQQLYLLNKDGRILWKRKFNGLINGKIQMIDGFDNDKFQMVFTTSKGLHFVDRNGNEISGFPVALFETCTAPPLCVRYNNQGDYRFVTNNGSELVNYDTEGKAVKGWKKATINGGLDGPVKYLRFAGKDYLIAMDLTHRVHILDRTGSVRQKAFDIDTNVYEISLVRGDRLEACRMIGHDSTGNLYSYDLNGRSSNENLLPLGRDVGLSTTNQDAFRYITNKADRVIALDKSRNVSLDYLMPEPLSRNIYTHEAQLNWVGFENAARTNYYLLDLNGRLLDKMPLSGQGPAVLLDLDQNGSIECILASASKGLVAYKLAD